MAEEDPPGTELAKRLVAAVRTGLPAEARGAEVRVSVLPGMILVRVNWDAALPEPRSFISSGADG